MRTGRIGGEVEAGIMVVAGEGDARVDVLVDRIVAKGFVECPREALRATMTPVV
jgi:hypothetical protein